MNNSLIRSNAVPFGGMRIGGMTKRLRRLVTMVGVLSVLVAGTVVGQAASPAFAAGYPSWNDVLAARNSVTAKQAEISRIDTLLGSLASTVTSAQDLANKKGAEFQAAQQKFDDAAYKASELTQQANDAKKKADGSKQQAGQLAAQLAKVGGGGDLSANLFFDGDNAKDLLAQLGLANVVK
ncbi:MAG: M23 family peptidase, partial [Leifsonia sp.]